MFNSLDITYQDLNKSISKEEKQKLDRKIKEWQKDGLLTGYFAYLVASKNKYTYSDMLELLIYGIYTKQNQEINKYSKEVLIEVAQDTYNQGYKEIKPKKKEKISWAYILPFLIVPIYNKTWNEYLALLSMTYAQEMYKNLLTNVQQDIKPTTKMLKPMINKQMNRILSINEDKYSGVLNDTSRLLGNRMYLEPAKEIKDVQVRFIAERDKRTTPMCESMDNMLFYVNDWNKFYRYSAIDEKNVLYTVKGLEVGVNLPPINNHFHWCRSTITYQTDMPREELNEKLKTGKEKDALNKWLSADFYTINDNMRRNIKLSASEKDKVKNLYRYLNKTPNYTGDIVRTLELYGEDLNKFIDDRQSGKIFAEKTFVAYSTKEGYNENANIKMYIFDSKNGKNLLQYNPDESEILYQYGKKFRTINYEKIKDIHYFELEEIDD